MSRLIERDTNGDGLQSGLMAWIAVNYMSPYSGDRVLVCKSDSSPCYEAVTL
jgi:hypothetical protein